MAREPIKVELVGLLPVLYEFCAKCRHLDPFKLARFDYVSEQMAGYPPEALEQQERLSELCHRLIQDFSGTVIAVPVGLLSLRGLWLSLKHRIRRGPVVVIDGKRVLSGALPYEAIRSAVQEELVRDRAG